MERFSLVTTAAEFAFCTVRDVAMANVARTGSRDTRSVQVKGVVSDGAGLQQGRRWWPWHPLQLLLSELTGSASSPPTLASVQGDARRVDKLEHRIDRLSSILW